MKNPKIDMYIDGKYTWSSYAYRTCKDALMQYAGQYKPFSNTMIRGGIKYKALIDHNAPKKEYPPSKIFSQWKYGGKCHG
jgi:hypothetical protein